MAKSDPDKITTEGLGCYSEYFSECAGCGGTNKGDYWNTASAGGERIQLCSACLPHVEGIIIVLRRFRGIVEHDPCGLGGKDIY